jgi:hypothetical protein
MRGRGPPRSLFKGEIMRKLISATMMGVLLTGLGIGISGCSEEAKEKSQVTTQTPGGKTTQTVEKKTETSGSNPPAPSKTP